MATTKSDRSSFFGAGLGLAAIAVSACSGGVEPGNSSAEALTGPVPRNAACLDIRGTPRRNSRPHGP